MPTEAFCRRQERCVRDFSNSQKPLEIACLCSGSSDTMETFKSNHLKSSPGPL